MIYLIRHGETDWNVERKIQGQTDIPLNSNGKKQAEEAANEIANLKIDRIISSDLSRAKETAEIINQKVGAEITYEKRLREVNYGDFEGIQIDKFTDKDWVIFNETPEKIKGESRQQVYNRVKSFIDEIKDDENVLVVTHGGSLRMMLYYAKNKENFDKNNYNMFAKDFWINNAKVVEYKEE